MLAGEAVNKGRQIELDIARALAVLFMVLVHVQMSFSNENLIDSNLGFLIDFMGGIPAAPMFMFLMGVGFFYTSKNNYQTFIKRGVSIFTLGYLLNYMRDSLPELVDYITYGEKASLTYAIEGFIDVDILQFAGLAMVFWGIIKVLRLKNGTIAFLGVLFPILNLFLVEKQVDNYIGQATSGLIWGSSEFSEFPFLTWIFYPILGYFFAQVLIRVQDKRVFYKKLLIISLPSVIVTALFFFYLLGQDLGLKSELAYYHHNIFANIVYGLFCISWISLLFFLAKYIPGTLMTLLKRWSKNVTEIYFIHWVIIGWLSWILDEYSAGLFMYCLLSVGILIAADVSSGFIKRRSIEIK
jgi:uncharacterized membrane protein